MTSARWNSGWFALFQFPTVPVPPLFLLSKTAHAPRATCISASICDPRSLCSCPPRAAQPHPSQRPSGVATPPVSRKPPDALPTFLTAYHTLNKSQSYPLPVIAPPRARADPGRAGLRWGEPAGARSRVPMRQFSFKLPRWRSKLLASTSPPLV